MVSAPVKRVDAGLRFVNILVLLLVLSAGAFVVYELGNMLFVPPAFGETQTAPAAQSGKASLQGLQNILVLTDVPPTLDFGKQMTGTTSGVQTVTLTAERDVSVEINVETPSNGDFSVLPTGCDLKSSASCAITITFSPKHEQKTTSSLKITATATPVTVPPTASAPNKTAAPQNPPTSPANALPENPSLTSGSGVILLMGEGTAGCPFMGPAFPERGWLKSKLPMLAVALVFLIVFLLVRWNMVAVPTRRWALAATEAVRSRVESLPDQTVPALDQIRGLLSTASNLITRHNQHFGDRLADHVFWSRGQEISAWEHVHEAEEQLVAFLPAANVRASLECDEPKLRQAGTPPALALADRIQEALAAEPAVPVERWRALLYEALGLLYDRTDTNFASLQSWQNKTVFLVGCGLLLIVTLGAALGNEVLFLVGATGGLLSRLMRTLFRENVPTDYGASWTTLFLSPVVGALMGWAGLLLVILGVKFNVLGSALNVDWCNPTAPTALALAFLLGFSERAFMGILSQLEAKAQASSPATPSSAGAALTVTTPPALGPGKVGQKYTQTLAASGGTPPYKWANISGQLPAGLNLDLNGTISGTPSAAGDATFTVQVTDDASNKKSQPFSISVTQ